MDNMDNVTPIPTEATAKFRSQRRHPAGMRIQEQDRCPECGHTLKGHTAKAHDGEGGCAYCKCQRTPESP